ncbi:c-type cytochrome [Magnetococcales bacterium HHB-1]
MNNYRILFIFLFIGMLGCTTSIESQFPIDILAEYEEKSSTEHASKGSFDAYMNSYRSLMTKDFGSAEKHLKQVLSVNEDDIFALNNLAIVYYQTNRIPLAQPLLEKLLKISKNRRSGSEVYQTALDNWMASDKHRLSTLTMKPDVDNGRQVYKQHCIRCHKPNAWGKKDGSNPELAGQHLSVQIKQLADIQNMNRDNPTMYPYAVPKKIGGKQALVDVSHYIATLPMTPDNGIGPGTNLEAGERIYKTYCAVCHGNQGEGDATRHYPRIGGQHYNYQVRQMEWIRLGKRRRAHPLKYIQLEKLTQEDIQAVSDYASRLRPINHDVATKNWRNPDFLDWKDPDLNKKKP